MGLKVYLAINLRLRPNRIPIPDLVITDPVDVKDLVLNLFRLEGKQYREYATGRPGMPLRMDAPVVVELDPDELLSDD